MNTSQTPNGLKITSLFGDDRPRSSDIVTIVVTCNRKGLLLECLRRLLDQSLKTDVLVVDNASTDGTESELKLSGLLDNERIHYLHLNINTGGAGGFHYGLKYAFDRGWNWFWMMDDDAEPHHDALEKLVEQSQDENSIYGSTAVADIQGKIKLCFPIKTLQGKQISLIEDYLPLDEREQVAWLPFLGFFLHRNTILKAGFPDKELFIRNDDVEYSERAKRLGINLYMIKESIIDHPYQPTIPFAILGKQMYYRSMPPWKMYYEVRNKIIIARRHYPVFKGMKSIAGVTFQVFLSLILEKEKKDFLRVFFKGMIDGLRSK